MRHFVTGRGQCGPVAFILVVVVVPVGEFRIPRAYYFGTHAKAIQTPVPSQGLNSSNA